MAKITLTARFKSGGVPQTGLSPTVNIYAIAENGTKTDIVMGGAMTELSDGFYSYQFTQFNILNSYLFSYDAGATSDARYIENEWLGLQDWVAVMPTGGGGGGFSYKGLTKAEVKMIADAMAKQVEELFKNIEFELPENELDVSPLLKELKAQSEKDKKEILAKLDKMVSEKLASIKPPVIQTQTVDLDDFKQSFKSEIDGLKKTTLKVDSDGVDELLGVFMKMLNAKMKDFEKAIESQVKDNAEAKALAKLTQAIKDSVK